jgi:hypothetical protein
LGSSESESCRDELSKKRLEGRGEAGARGGSKSGRARRLRAGSSSVKRDRSDLSKKRLEGRGEAGARGGSKSGRARRLRAGSSSEKSDRETGVRREVRPTRSGLPSVRAP